MHKEIRTIIELAEEYLERYQLEFYEPHVDQTYKELYWQARTVCDNAGGLTATVKKKFDSMVSETFDPDSLSNLIAILRTIEMFMDAQPQDNFWHYLHPKITSLAKPLFDIGRFADAVLCCLREANGILKQYVKGATGKEFDGAALMTRTFSVANPILVLADLTTESGRNIQLGYMKIFEGMMTGVRNPKAHENLYPNKDVTIHLLFHASFLFLKLEELSVIGPSSKE